MTLVLVMSLDTITAKNTIHERKINWTNLKFKTSTQQNTVLRMKI